MTPKHPFTFHTPSHPDARGSFLPIPLFLAGRQFVFQPTQINVSTSKPDVVRGMHWQENVPQAKLIAVLSGSILDVVVNLNREDKKNFGQISCFLLGPKFDSTGADVLYVPKGYAHGFRSGPDGATVIYGVDMPYNPSDERGFSPLDIPSFGDISKCIMSEKDRNWPRLRELFPDIGPRVFPLDSGEPPMVQ